MVRRLTGAGDLVGFSQNWRFGHRAEAEKGACEAVFFLCAIDPVFSRGAILFLPKPCVSEPLRLIADQSKNDPSRSPVRSACQPSPDDG